MNAPNSLIGGDAAFVDLADLDFFGHAPRSCRVAASAPAASAVGDVDRAVVLDVDLGAGRFLDAADRLAARADEQADLFRD